MAEETPTSETDVGCWFIKMADTEELQVEGKPLSGLRVVDLKQELEKRGLSKSGTKKELHDRLKMQLQLEKLQENAAKTEGQLPNLAMQDDEIAEQSDVVKEYLAKQQQIYEQQKEVRRKVEMEEEEKGKSNEEKLISEIEVVPEEVKDMKDVSEVEVQPVINPSDFQETSKDDKPLDTPASTDDNFEDSRKEKDEEKICKTKDSESNADTCKNEGNIEKELIKESTKGVEENIDENIVIKSKSEEESLISKDEESSVTTKSGEPYKIDKDEEGTAVKNEDKTESNENSDQCSIKAKSEKEICKNSDESEYKKDSKDESIKNNETEITTKSESEEETSRFPEQESTKQQISRSRSRSPSPERSNSQDSSRRSRSSSSSSCSSNSSSSSSNSSKSQSCSHSNHSSRSRSKSPEKQDEKSNRSRSKSPEKMDVTEADLNKDEKNKVVPEDVPAEKNTENESEQQKMEESEEKPEEKVKKKHEKKTKSIQDDIEERKESPQNEATEPADAEHAEDGNSNTQKSQENSTKPVMKITMRKISINSSKESHKNKENIDVSSDGDKPTRKRKWGSSTTKAVKKTSLTISTDSLKNLIPDVAPLPAVVIGDSLPDIQEASASETDEAKETMAVKDLKICRTVTQVVNEEPMILDQIEADQTKLEVQDQITQIKPLITTSTKPAEEPLERPHSPSPARNPINKIIHIRNLVRPFTLNQLKEVLGRTGTLVERGFWIDKIKSKCYATYESVEQAVATRQALHGVQWPPSNRKNLIVDYADEDEFNFHVNLTETSEIHKSDLRKELPLRDSTRRVRENITALPNTQLSKSKERPPLPPPIREWDRDKIGERSPGEKVRARHHRSKSPSSPSRDRKRDRSKEHKEKREKRDRKKEEETPSKLLDDLFKKTKSTPCIYWLPLTVEQIKIRDEENKKREEERKKKQIEREKRRQELEKEKGKDSTSDSKKTRNGDEKSNKRRSASPSRSRNRKR